ncbi:taste receptor type 2 member 4-like [Dendropsophus ebraccatus]|uniref:taste receptor type 2 member 4-like n=1 Tax=Dendropsophus ebraccatus TaxID=150705 RepID=UPI003831D6B8
MSPQAFFFDSMSCFLIGTGLLLNGFIVIVNLLWWMKGQTIQTIKVLLTGLGLVRLVLLSMYVKYIYYLVARLPLFQADSYPEYTATFMVCIASCSLWWGSVLCVFYCVKITNYTNAMVTRLKMKISKMVPWLLLGSLFVSCLSTLPCRWMVFSSRLTNGTENGNTETNVANLVSIVLVTSIVPFMIFCVAISLIIVSLLRHARNMCGRDSGFSDAQRDVHLSVLRSMVSFLLFYALYSVSYIVFTIIINAGSPTFTSACFTGLCAYPSLHSISLIVSNKDLKNSFCFVLSCTWLRIVQIQPP